MHTELLASTIQSFGVPDFFIQITSSHPYGIIFLCLLFGGGIVLFPAFYLSVMGILKWWYIIAVMVVAAALADAFWYLVGLGVLPKFVESLTERGKYVSKLSKISEGKELIILFYSKFIYGTRIAVQIVCGARKINFPSYLAVNSVAVSILGVIYYLIVRFTSVGVDSFGEIKYKLVVVLSVTVLLVGTIHFLVYRFFKNKLY
jgi:membrane protein DedA with SNARE-associated domain